MGEVLWSTSSYATIRSTFALSEAILATVRRVRRCWLDVARNLRRIKQTWIIHYRAKIRAKNSNPGGEFVHLVLGQGAFPRSVDRSHPVPVNLLVQN